MKRWLIFFIISCSIASLCLLFIPYPETQVINNPTNIPGGGKSWMDRIEVGFPWRAYNKEIFLNVSLTQGTINLQIFDNRYNNEEGLYWEILNTTGFTTTIQIYPPNKGFLFIYFDPQNGSSIFHDIYSEIKISYLRYASSYGFVFLGIVVILISHYGYIKYKINRNVISVESVRCY